MSEDRENDEKTQATVAIVGGGLAGTLVAANLLRRSPGPLRIVLVERSGDFGPGVAYSTFDEGHLLNVCAARMSAFCDAPLHFLTWARKRLGEVDAGAYLPRRLYGEYLRELLDDELALAPGTAVLERVTDEAIGLTRCSDGGLTVELSEGGSLACDRAVIATGSVEPSPPLELPDDPRVVLDPWAEGAFDGLPRDARAVLIGTSLTAVDVALTLSERAPAGRSVAVSRRGLVPFTHLPGLREPAPEPTIEDRPMTVEEIEGELREYTELMRSEGYDWREVIDSVRPFVQRLWRQLGEAEQRRFLRDRVREWDVRRHRIAPEVGARLSELRDTGRLQVRAGGIESVEVVDDASGLMVRVAGSDSGSAETIEADVVVSCAGAGADIAAGAHPLLAGMFEDGIATPDALGLGVSAGRCGALVGGDGSACEDIYVLGPLRRGELWESVAAREIRIQAEDVAAELIERCELASAGPGPLSSPAASARSSAG